jgi:hypothetical protein
MKGRVIAARRDGRLIVCAVEYDEGWEVNPVTKNLPRVHVKTESDAMAWVTDLVNANNYVAAESPVVAVTGRELEMLLNLFKELATRPYVPPVVRMWIDPIDKAFKVKAGNGTWSPPFGEIEVSA